MTKRVGEKLGYDNKKGVYIYVNANDYSQKINMYEYPESLMFCDLEET